MTLAELNALDEDAARDAFARCCGARRFAAAMAARRPFASSEAMRASADEVLASLLPADYREAFSHHGRIGDLGALRARFAATRAWAEGEQAGTRAASDAVLRRLADGNARYEARFGYIFIVCATGKTAGEMLALLEARLANDPEREIAIAWAEQCKITHLRLEKLLLQES
jgi:2-oxo-4-hydroxy-4-carboxy-5-ureidoimidazoline decarboxylase